MSYDSVAGSDLAPYQSQPVRVFLRDGTRIEGTLTHLGRTLVTIGGERFELWRLSGFEPLLEPSSDPLWGGRND